MKTFPTYLSYTAKIISLCCLVLLGCKKTTKENNVVIAKTKIAQPVTVKIQKTLQDSISFLFNSKPEFVTNGFDYPVGKPNAKGYYNAQGFTKNNHLGDDWNAVTGGNSDLGDPIYAIANGYVNFAEDAGSGWGNVMRIWHYSKNRNIVESLYAHCNTMDVMAKNFVKKGEQIGTIGNANGAYLAHLHFEIRDNLKLPIGGGYSNNTEGYLDPTLFIKTHREE